MNRQKFIKRTFWGLSGIGFFSGLYSWQIEPFWLEFVKVKMPIKNLSRDLVGKTLMQISDIHIGNRFDYHFIINSFKKAREFNPDFVVYTGDYVSTYKDEVQYNKLEETLKNAVKGKAGTIGILGNHDYGRNWSQSAVADKVSEMLKSNGINLLRNESTEVNGLNFIGFDDFWGLNFNPEKAMNSFDKSKANIVLCHNPDVCDLNIWGNYNSWILSGHTHGGQVKPPFLPAPMLPVKNKKYSAGQIELSNDRTLYINRALGHLWQVRFNVRPEITIFELTNSG
ncbi:metallophosphoesterase [Algoriphagus sp. AGSA1]|uniref:metallophosphoesterase n=1 Tax=Algoriphagus sp. AGSA1 TaxID=2907213 RepID=UPI001F1B1ECC|nr:metallophosphoesterase [Algoriphagus sp. AGSA1]MCE7057046.1 metallophosphoesterase [Algoriphagus sp. AGSA1]